MSAKQLTVVAQDEVKIRAETEKIALQILALNKAPMVPVQEVCRVDRKENQHFDACSHINIMYGMIGHT